MLVKSVLMTSRERMASTEVAERRKEKKRRKTGRRPEADST